MGDTCLQSIETSNFITMSNTCSLCSAELCMTKSNILSIFCMMCCVLVLVEKKCVIEFGPALSMKKVD